MLFHAERQEGGRGFLGAVIRKEAAPSSDSSGEENKVASNHRRIWWRPCPRMREICSSTVSSPAGERSRRLRIWIGCQTCVRE